MATILCVDLDPFLVDLVRRLRPADEVLAEEWSSADSVASRSPSAVLVAASSPAVEDLAGTRIAPRVIAVSANVRDAPPGGHAGPILTRPIAPPDLSAVLLEVVPGTLRGQLLRTLRRLNEAVTPEATFAVLRVVAVVVGAVVAATQVPDATDTWALAALSVLVVVRAPLWTMTSRAVLIDAIVTLAAMLATGGATSPYVLLGAVVASSVGYAFRPRSGSLVVGALTLAGAAQLTVLIVRGTAEAGDLISWSALLPLSAISGVLAGRIRRGRVRSSREQLLELNRTLDRLFRQAQGVAGALEQGTVASEIVSSATEDADADVVAVLLGTGGVLELAGAHALEERPPRVVVEGEQTAAAVLEAIRPHVRAPHVRVHDMTTTTGFRLGWLVAGWHDAAQVRTRAQVLRELAEESALALENVRLFTRIRQMSVDRERQRVARDLHDGVIQSLVHVGFELDLLASSRQDEELRSLREVITQTVDEVRGTVNDLRSSRLEEGLGPALRSLAREFERVDGPRIEVHIDNISSITPEVELQFLRIAQEAISNSLQHARATCVRIEFSESRGQVWLAVTDDGVGVHDETEATTPLRGVGLQAMAERARLLGATLHVTDEDGGGTRIEVTVEAQGVAP